jgi:hypothetical protein
MLRSVPQLMRESSSRFRTIWPGKSSLRAPQIRKFWRCGGWLRFAREAHKLFTFWKLIVLLGEEQHRFGSTGAGLAASQLLSEKFHQNDTTPSHLPVKAFII